MEKRINEQLKTAKRQKMAHSKPENASARERQRLNQMDTTGSGIDSLTDFNITNLEEILLEDGLATEVVKLIGQGKEADVYWIRDEDGKNKALKLFRMFTTSHRNSFSRRGDTGKLQVAEEMALQEYLNLSYAQEGGVRVPKMGVREEFIFTMDFLGDDRGCAPLIRNVDFVELGYDPLIILDEILDQLEIMFNDATLVHGDFSQHNLVWYKEQVWVIDFLQSSRWHPSYDTPERIRKQDALHILRQDLNNILKHFKSKYRVGYYADTVMEALVHDEVEDDSPMELMSEYYDPDWINHKGRR